MKLKRLAFAAATLIASAAAAQQTPTLPPPGSIVTPPAAPNPAAPPAPPSQPETNRMPEIGGPTDIVLEARPVIVMRGESTWDDGFDNLMEAFKKLRDEAAKHKLTVLGKPQAAFTSTDDHGFKYEAMFTLDMPPPQPAPKLGAEFAFGESPAGKALKFTHSGAYDDIDTTYEAITAYLDEKNLKARNVFVEEYITEPKSSDDADLQMNILVLVE